MRHFLNTVYWQARPLICPHRVAINATDIGIIRRLNKKNNGCKLTSYKHLASAIVTINLRFVFRCQSEETIRVKTSIFKRLIPPKLSVSSSGFIILNPHVLKLFPPADPEATTGNMVACSGSLCLSQGLTQ